MKLALFPLMAVVVVTLGCAAPNYLSVSPADPVGQDPRLTPHAPQQAIAREQHLGQLRAEVRFLEDAFFRAEQERLTACRVPEAAQANTVAYHRCQLKAAVYEQLKEQAALSRERYLRAVTGRGGGVR